MAKKKEFFDNHIALQGIYADGSLGMAGQVLTSDGENVYWGSGGGGGDADTLEGHPASDFVLVSDYSDSDVLAKILNVDGAGSGLDSDFLDGQSSAFYLAWANFTGKPTTAVGYGITGGANLDAFAGLTLIADRLPYANGTGTLALTTFTSAARDLLDDANSAAMLTTLGALAASSYTAADVLSKLLTVDGTGSGLDADLLDGNSSAYFLAAASYTAADVLSKLLTVDGAGSGLDADLLDGFSSAAFGRLAAAETVTGGWSFTTAMSLMGAMASGSTFLRFTNSTTTHAMNMLFDDTGTTYKLMPRPSGANDTAREMGYDFTNTRWFFDTVPYVTTNVMWHAGNDGSGSGLDADLFDGNDSTAFAFLSGAAFTGAVSVTVAGTPLTLTNSTDSASNIGLSIQSDRATPAANDSVRVEFRLSDSAGNQDVFARIDAVGTTVTSTSEVGDLYFSVVQAGAITTRMRLSGAFTALVPHAHDGLALGTDTLRFSDLSLAAGAVIVFGAAGSNDVLITHSTNTMTFSGAASGWKFAEAVLPNASDGAALGSATLMWSDMFLASGAVINWNNGNLTLTHSAGVAQFSAASSAATVRVTNTTDTASNTGLIIESDRATPAANDNISLEFRLSDSAGNQDVFGYLRVLATDVTSTSEDARLDFFLMAGGASAGRMILNPTSLTPYTSDGLALGTTANMWSDMFLASGAVINWNNGDVLQTHSTNTMAWTGASSGYTFDAAISVSGNVVWHPGNDGTGSGLDADLWDGNNFATYLNQALLTSSSPTFVALTTTSGIVLGTTITANATSTRDKIRVWNAGTYSIGMGSGYTFGNLNDYAMTFQMSATAQRGWWWGTSSHTNAQGSMSLSTQGNLHVLNSITVASTSNTVWHLGNDGAGSGLDADLLDGYSTATAGTANTIALRTSTGQLYAGGTGNVATTAALILSGSYGGGLAFSDTNYAGIYVQSAGTEMIFYTNGTTRLTIDGSGNLTATGNVSAYSDIRLKKDFLHIENALDKIDQLTGWTFTRRDTGERQTGLIAQDVEKVMPEVVTETMDGTKSVAYGNLMGLVVEAIKDLRAEINELKKKLP